MLKRRWPLAASAMILRVRQKENNSTTWLNLYLSPPFGDLRCVCVAAVDFGSDGERWGKPEKKSRRTTSDDDDLSCRELLESRFFQGRKGERFVTATSESKNTSSWPPPLLLANGLASVVEESSPAQEKH
jgi:hypothetical protein